MNGALQVKNIGLLVVIFVAVGLVSGDLPGGAVEVDIKFGQFILDGNLLEFRLRWNFVAESHAVVENSKTKRHDTLGVFFFGQIESRLGIIIGNIAIFTPGEFDSFFVAFFLFADELEVICQRLFATNQKTELGGLDDRLVVFIDRIVNAPRGKGKMTT